MTPPPSDLTVAAVALGFCGIPLGWTLIVPAMAMAAGVRAARADPGWRPLSICGVLAGFATFTISLSAYIAFGALLLELQGR